MSLSWPPRYTSIHELSNIINSPNILRLSSFVLASLQQLNSCSCNQDLYCNSMHSHWQYRLKIRCALYLAFEWRVQPNIWIYMNDWLGNKLDFDFSLAAEPWPFFADTSPRDIGARWFQGPSRDQLLWKLEWYSKLMSWWEQTGATEFYLWFLTEKIVWGITAVTR